MSELVQKLQRCALDYVSEGPITLQVGDRRFKTTVQTLVQKSGYFKKVFSGPSLTQKFEEGPLFVDADPGLFGHILNYLRRGVFPLKFNATQGHDYGFYATLLQEAKYFQRHGLVTFLEDQCFHKCVTWETTSQDCDWNFVVDESSVTSVQLFRDRETEGKVYICPRGIDCHRGSPEACGCQCQKALGDDEPSYDTETVSKYQCVKRKLRFNPEWMAEDGRAFAAYQAEQAILKGAGSA
ncbi:hypothetical protein AJ79_06017 [Helicocarpus griseus UAMH5409]|uniref:BTB domain-containing protein n=1 Tax=Helicocarpus griseus UAMH5409 TaxID=1447875 RepID=A0A2B7XHD9_9EURO|nr:hypothetical protein AJ79_06017 [Helicocarpus griseus UAMH5409]